MKKNSRRNKSLKKKYHNEIILGKSNIKISVSVLINSYISINGQFRHLLTARVNF